MGTFACIAFMILGESLQARITWPLCTVVFALLSAYCVHNVMHIIRVDDHHAGPIDSRLID